MKQPTFTVFLKGVVLLLGWWLGRGRKRKARAQELHVLLGEIRKGGDLQGEKTSDELSEGSGVEWSQISEESDETPTTPEP